MNSLSSSLTVYCAWCPLKAADKCWNNLMDHSPEISTQELWYSRFPGEEGETEHGASRPGLLLWPYTFSFLFLLTQMQPQDQQGSLGLLMPFEWPSCSNPPAHLHFFSPPFFPCLWGCRQWKVGCTLAGCLPSRLNTLLHPRFEHYLQDEKLTMLTHRVK